MSATTPVRQLAEFAVDSRDALPDPVTADAVGRILDVVGNALAATALADSAEPHTAVLRVMTQRGGRPEAGVIGSGTMLPASSAALVNGTLAHALDFDDTHLPSVLHPSSSVVPAALATAQACGASGMRLLSAVAIGNEICVRLGVAGYSAPMRNSVFFEKGFHATSICGTVGAAAAASVIYGLDAAQTASALGIAASMGAGLIEANRTGGSVKRIHCGWAAHAGIEAAAFAAEGITGPPTVLEGRFGFLRAYLDDDYDLGALLAGLGGQWEALRTVYKPYPSNHFTHPGIDCALALRAQGLRAADIAWAELGVAAAPLRTIGEPRDQKIRPESGYHAKFSGPYTVASAFLGGGGLGLGLNDFTTAAVGDRHRLELAEKITVVADAICDEQFPSSFSAVLRVGTTSGAVLEHRVSSSRGGPEFPLTLEELERKFLMNAEHAASPDQSRQIADRVRSLPAMPSVARLLSDAGLASQHVVRRRQVPTYAELRARTDAPAGSSWHVFGEGDQLGSLNFLTADHAVDAAGLVRDGRVFNLDYPVNAFDPVVGGTRKTAKHQIFMNNPYHRDDWLDSFYLQSTSQIDGLRHIRDPLHGFYAGVPDEAVGVGLPDLGIQLAAEKGIAGRGVLLDVARHLASRGTELDLSSNYMITVQDLEDTAAACGMDLRSGDIVLIRTGWAPYYLAMTPQQRASVGGSIRSPGLIQSHDMIAWLWDHQFSLVAADNPALEAFPVSDSPGIAGPPEPAPERGVSHNGMLHRPIIALLGLYIGELWNLEELSAACLADGRYEFFLTAKPLNVIGGVGSPPNAMAIR
ncbi:MAG TPA: MmgE/PrpD family protein [Streptosporangiaceae bacterium]|nr:MmgE/PrpD family protein [Streptosporangiaceae bacterium]